MLHYFKEPKKFPENLDYFCKKNCCQEVQKIAQSGHTDRVRRALERVGGRFEMCQIRSTRWRPRQGLFFALKNNFYSNRSF